jgi:hypothetical protein
VERLVDRILAAKQRDAGADVSAWERELDELVNALYGFTPEEIKIVDENANGVSSFSPRVAEPARLPWVARPKNVFQPQRGCALPSARDLPQPRWG